MTALLPVLLVALATVAAVGALAWWGIAPAVIWWLYRRNIPVNRLARPDIDQGAGSRDLDYFVGLFDLSDGDITIRAPVPDARYWMVGLYDCWMRDIPTAHRNDRAIAPEGDGTFIVTLCSDPRGKPNPLVTRHRRGMIMYRILLPEAEVGAPTVTAG